MQCKRSKTPVEAPSETVRTRPVRTAGARRAACRRAALAPLHRCHAPRFDAAVRHGIVVPPITPEKETMAIRRLVTPCSDSRWGLGTRESTWVDGWHLRAAGRVHAPGQLGLADRAAGAPAARAWRPARLVRGASGWTLIPGDHRIGARHLAGRPRPRRDAGAVAAPDRVRLRRARHPAERSADRREGGVHRRAHRATGSSLYAPADCRRPPSRSWIRRRDAVRDDLRCGHRPHAPIGVPPRRRAEQPGARAVGGISAVETVAAHAAAALAKARPLDALLEWADEAARRNASWK